MLVERGADSPAERVVRWGGVPSSLLKSLNLVRPGGLVAVLTSRYTLDAHNPAPRREMAALADLVGAVRLPAGAFREIAGTDVVCDLLVLRRRPARERIRRPSAAGAPPASSLILRDLVLDLP